jgi:AcrR family transcriptional regulator
MPRTTSRTHYLRARSDSEKSERRRAILAAADEHVRAVGFDAFSMAVLAKKAGIAKGTLFLYFETREEVLLSLHSEQLASWCAAVTRGTRVGITDEAFVALFLQTALADPVFLDLTARLGSVIEHNISIDRLVESKRMMRSVLLPLTEHLERCLGLEPGAGTQALASLTALLLGASQIDAGPSLDGEEIPTDVQRMVAMFSCNDVFSAHAPMLIAGVRARAAAKSG